MFGEALMNVIRYGRIAAYLRRMVSVLVASALVICVVGHTTDAAQSRAGAAGLFAAASIQSDDDSSTTDHAKAECCHCICAHAFLPAVERAPPSIYSSTVVPVGSLVSLHDSSLPTESPPPRT